MLLYCFKLKNLTTTPPINSSFFFIINILDLDELITKSSGNLSSKPIERPLLKINSELMPSRYFLRSISVFNSLNLISARI